MPIYTASFTDTAVTTAIDVFEFTAADDKPIELVGLMIGQITELGDAAEEQIDFTIQRGHTTSGTGSTVTPRPIRPNQATVGFACETGGTATAGTSVVLHSDAWNVRAGYQMWWPSGMGPATSQAELLVVRLETAPADSVTMVATAYVREMPD